MTPVGGIQNRKCWKNPGGQRASDGAGLDQISRATRGRVHPGLQTDGHMDRLRPRCRGHLGGFVAVAPKRPFAIHMLVRLERGKNQIAVIRHPDAHRDDVDVRRRDQGKGIVVGRAHTERRRGRVGGGTAGGRHRRQLHAPQGGAAPGRENLWPSCDLDWRR